MNINRLNISSSVSASPQVKLSLNPGQIINAQIVKSEGSQIMLQYGSYLFKAQTDMALKPGEKLKLSVESVKDHLIHLKIIDGQESKQPESITALLIPGLKPDPNLETIARQLTKFNLPVSLEILTELNKFLKKNKLSADIGQLVVWLKSAGIEVNSDQDIRALQVLYKFFQGELTNEQEPKYFEYMQSKQKEQSMFKEYKTRFLTLEQFKEIDPYGEEYSKNTLVINVRSQMSSLAKNSDTLFERTFAEAMNLHMQYPDIVLGEVYLIPINEYDDEEALQILHKQISGAKRNF